jgi:indole-3-glycerol phosphate synthase
MGGEVSAPADILERIVATKHQEVEVLRKRVGELRAGVADVPPARDFRRCLKASGSVAVIAEIKRRSPGAGAIRPDLDPLRLAPSYESHGASALSVLTDSEYFGGSLEDLQVARSLVDIPILRKDFIVDEAQIFEARMAGADAILLIVSILDDDRIRAFRVLAEELGMSALVEAHSGDEVERALASGARLLGVNNRDLRTFEARIDVTLGLAAQVSSDVVLVSESGIHTADDVVALGKTGVDAVLVGESLLRQTNPGEGLSKLVGHPRRSRVRE